MVFDNFDSFLKISKILQISFGCVKAPNASSHVSLRILSRAYTLLIFLLIVILTADNFSLFDPSVTYTAYEILMKCKEISFGVIGLSALVISLRFRKKIHSVFDTISSFEFKGYRLTLSQSDKIFNIVLLTQAAFHTAYSIYVDLDETYGALFQERKLIFKAFCQTQSSTTWFLVCQWATCINDVLIINLQTTSCIFLSILSNFVADAYAAIADEFSKLQLLKQSGPNNASKKGYYIALYKLKANWNSVLTVERSLRKIGGLFLLGTFPFLVIIVVTRIGRLTLGVLQYNKSDISIMNLVFGVIYLAKFLLLVEIGHYYHEKVIY